MRVWNWTHERFFLTLQTLNSAKGDAVEMTGFIVPQEGKAVERAGERSGKGIGRDSSQQKLQ